MKKQIALSESVFLGLSGEIYTLQQFAGSMTAGGGAAVDLGLDINLTEKATLGLGGRLGCDITPDDIRCFTGAGLGVSWE